MEGRAGQGTARGVRFVFTFCPIVLLLKGVVRPSVHPPAARRVAGRCGSRSPLLKGKLTTRHLGRGGGVRGRVFAFTHSLAVPPVSAGRSNARRTDAAKKAKLHSGLLLLGKCGGGCVLQTDRSSRHLDINTICLLLTPKISVAPCPSLETFCSRFQLFFRKGVGG